MRRNAWLIVILTSALLLFIFQNYLNPPRLPPHHQVVTPKADEKVSKGAGKGD